MFSRSGSVSSFRYLPAAGFALLLAFGLGCSSFIATPLIATNDQQVESSLNSIPTPSRIAAGAGEEYLARHDGADFATDLPMALCSISGSTALFTPSWEDPRNTGKDDPAYCIYRLKLDPQLESAELTSSWDTPPASSDRWLGLSNWDTDRWTWQYLPAGGNVTITSPALVADEQQHCLAALVVLGDSPLQILSIGVDATPEELTYPIVDTSQDGYFSDHGSMTQPQSGQDYYGQDANYDGKAASYIDNGDGTVTDEVTGLMWQQSPNNHVKLAFDDIDDYAAGLVLGGYDDWRVPSIKELYSLMDFTGETGQSELNAIPYLDDSYFHFEYGDTSASERYIDAQYWTSTEYVSTTMNNDETVFGVNFADGRIKGYPKIMPGPVPDDKLMFIRCVRGNQEYGINDFSDNGDGTITDNATSLMWMTQDSGHLSAAGPGDGGLNWQEALAWAENLDYAGHTDWRLPDAKELQSLLDYSRSPDTTGSAAIDPLFQASSIMDEGASSDYPSYWTGTTHLDGAVLGEYAVYLCFGEAMGFMEMPPDSGNYSLLDVHGAGAQRSDPKSGDPADYPFGHGPQGDVIRIYNYVRCVREGSPGQ